jgi:hypothetical protein
MKNKMQGMLTVEKSEGPLPNRLPELGVPNRLIEKDGVLDGCNAGVD